MPIFSAQKSPNSVATFVPRPVTCSISSANSTSASTGAEQGFHSCAHWLNFHCGIGKNAAREKIRVAHALGDRPRIHAAFAEGRVSYSKVRAITRIADASNNVSGEAPVAQRRADALSDVAETYLSNSNYNGATADRFQVVVHTRPGSDTEIECGPDVTAVTSAAGIHPEPDSRVSGHPCGSPPCGRHVGRRGRAHGALLQ